MSETRIMYISTLCSPNGGFLNLTECKPGDMVCYYMAPKSLGVIVEIINDEECKVLWSHFSNPWENVIRPGGSNYSQIAQQIFQVQPMPPGALPFYLDMVEKRMKES
jgi:hypothetical protein